MLVKRSDFLLVLSAATLLMIIFTTMFLAAKVKSGSTYRVSKASYTAPAFDY